MPEAPVQLNTPVVPENSDDAVRARFNESMRAAPPEDRANVMLNDPPKPPEQKPPVEKEKPVEGKDLDVPSEFFDDPKPPVDEWSKITEEEQKGHIKSEQWNSYKKLTKAKVESLQKELEETRSKLPKDDFVPERTAKELERLQKQLKERDDLISRKYIQDSPEFKEKFSSKESILNSQIEELGKDVGLDPDQINAILHATRKQRFQLLEEIENGAAKADMAATLSERDRLQKEKDLYLQEKEKSNVSWQEQQEHQTDQQKAKQKELYDYAFNEVLEKMGGEYGPLKKIPGNDAWNKAVDADIAMARDMYNGKDFTPQRDAEMFLAAASAKRLMKMFENAKVRAVTAEKELSELKAAGPSASQAENGKGHDPTKGMSNDERAKYTFNTEVARAANNGFAR